MLSWLKNRMHKRYDDLEDIRSSVLGNDFRNPPEPDFPRREAGRLEAPAFDPIERHFGEPFEPRFEQPPGFSTVDTRFPEPQINERGQRDYDILDRLNLIESQLAAIRSQTETINERLKNLEARLTRRY